MQCTFFVHCAIYELCRDVISLQSVMNYYYYTFHSAFECLYVFWLITAFLIAFSCLMSVCVHFPFQVYTEQVTTRMEHVNSTPI